MFTISWQLTTTAKLFDPLLEPCSQDFESEVAYIFAALSAAGFSLRPPRSHGHSTCKLKLNSTETNDFEALL